MAGPDGGKRKHSKHNGLGQVPETEQREVRPEMMAFDDLLKAHYDMVKAVLRVHNGSGEPMDDRDQRRPVSVERKRDKPSVWLFSWVFLLLGERLHALFALIRAVLEKMPGPDRFL
jgi:hypothetical protein